MELIVGFILGVVGGLLTNALWARRRRIRAWLHELRQGEEPLRHDAREDGFYVINRWSPARPLRRERLETLVVESRPEQRWLEAQRHRTLVEELSTRSSGEVCFLVDFDVDSWESAATERFRMYLARCSYAEHLATTEYLRQVPEAADEIKAALDGGEVREFSRSSPPLSIGMNVAVISERRRFLAVRRSGAVDVSQNLWTIGPNEAMKLPSREEPGRAEDLFSLAERCLKEEVDLDRDAYGDIYISWIGYYFPRPRLQVTVKAATVTHLDEAEVLDRLSGSHSVFEAEHAEWIPLNRRTLAEIIRNWDNALGRSWTRSSRLGAQELWRMRALLGPAD